MKKILFLALATMLSVAAMAQRERPTFNGATGTFLADKTVYLLHVATNQFYCAGNDYGTHASLSAEAGIPLIFETTEMNNGDGLVVYQIKNLVPKDNAWKYAFLEPFVVDELVQSYQMYTDARSQPDVYFCIEDVEEGGTYRIYGSEANEECKHSGDFANFYVTLDPEYIDKDGNQTGTGIVYAASDQLPQNQWAFVYADEYEKYMDQWAAYYAAEELAKLIEEAEEYGIDATAAWTAYNDPALTEEQLKEAYKALLDKISKYYEENVSPSEPVDMGKFLQNADFEASLDGWENVGGVSSFEHYNRSTWAGMFDGTYVTGDHYLNLWNASAVSGPVASQTIEDIPNGVYAFTAAAYSDADGGYVFAGNFKMPVKSGDASETSKATDYTVLTLVTDNQLSFGYWSEHTGNFWSVMDNARLMYYGTGEDAYGEWVDKSIEQAEDFTGAICKQQLIDDYNVALQNLKDADLEDGEKLMVSVQAYLSSMEAVKSNIAKYEELSEAIATAQEEIATADEKMDGLWETYIPKVQTYISEIAQPALEQHALSDELVDVVIDGLNYLVSEGKQTFALYIQMSEMVTNALEAGIEKYGSSCSAEALANAQQLDEDIKAYIAAGEVKDNEELREWMSKIEEAVKQLRIPVKEGTDDDPVDYTYAIVNPGFENGLTGWTNENGISTCENGTWGLDGTYFSGSAYLNLWSGVAQEPKAYYITQTIENLPNGTYDVCAAAFTKVPNSTFIFANEDNYVADNSTTDMEGQYYHVITKVTDGTLKLGVIIYVEAQYIPEGIDGVWSTVDNFTLYSYGPNSTHESTGNMFAEIATGVNRVTVAQPAAQQVFDLSGRRVAAGKGVQLRKGLYIINGKKVWVR